MTIPENTVTLHRVLKASPEKVYRAFTEPLAYASWIPPYGFLCVVHQSDYKVGGSYKMSFINFTTGTELKIVQENIPSVIPLDMCYLGWQDFPG